MEKALTADTSGRYVLAAAFFRHAANEALRLHGETFVCTFLTLERAASLCCQAQLEGVTTDEEAAPLRRSLCACVQLPAADC